MPVRPSARFASTLLVVLYLAVDILAQSHVDWLGSVRRDYPDALIWLSATNDVSTFGLLAIGLIAVLLYFLLPGSVRPWRLLAGAYLLAAGIGAMSLWAGARSGVAVYAGPVIIRAGEPWKPDVHVTLKDADHVVAGCISSIGKGGHVDRFLLYIVQLDDGRDIRLGDAAPREGSAADWIAAMKQLSPFLDASKVTHIRHADAEGRAYPPRACLDFFHAGLSGDDFLELLRILRVTPAELGKGGVETSGPVSPQ